MLIATPAQEREHHRSGPTTPRFVVVVAGNAPVCGDEGGPLRGLPGRSVCYVRSSHRCPEVAPGVNGNLPWNMQSGQHYGRGRRVHDGCAGPISSRRFGV